MKRFIFTKGFTLIELMVATSIFITIMLIAMSSIVTSSNSAKQSQGLREAMDNVNFAMDTVSRSIRIGTNYACTSSGSIIPLSAPSPADCPVSGNSYGTAIVFMPSASAVTGVGAMSYQNAIRADGTHTLQRCTTNGCIDIVSLNVDVQVLKFFVNGSNPDTEVDTIQPSVYILMKGIVIANNIPTSFAIQTIASQRSSE